MDEEKSFKQRLWKVKLIYCLLALPIFWDPISKLKEPVGFIYKSVINPAVIYFSGVPPNPDLIADERHAFLAGCYSYELFVLLKNRTDDRWDQAFIDQKDHLEASLMALGFPGSGLVKEINPNNKGEALAIYQRLRTHMEAYLDKKSNSNFAAFKTGFGVRLLMEVSPANTLPDPSVMRYIRDIKNNLISIRASTTYRLPTLAIERINEDACCEDIVSALVDTFQDLKKFFGVALT
jgi:hypothetical protein